ncbi:DoxX family protein, partial [Rhizobium ruizarguesonis]
MIGTSKLTPYVLAILRIITALLFLEHATMKLLQLPGPIQGAPYPLPAIMTIAGAIEVIT